MIKTIKTMSALLLTLFILVSCSKEHEAKTLFNDGWKYKLVDKTESNNSKFYTSDYDDTQWADISLPHTAHIEPLVVNDQWQGICWYRKSFVVGKELEDKNVIFEFEAAMNHSKFWINGEEITIHQGGYLPVVFDATKYLNFGERNTIAVRLNNKDNATTGPKPLKILDFNMYGGLYRNAWMIVKNDVHITHSTLAEQVAGGGTFITFPKVSKEQSIVKVKTNIANTSNAATDVKLRHSIYFKGQLVKQIVTKAKHIGESNNTDFTEKITVDNAQLWSPDAPNLYSLITEVIVNDVVSDSEQTRFGIREFTFNEKHELAINGKPTYLRGVNRHQEYPFIGYALSDNAQYRDAKKIKDGGFDYIRLSHYPHSPAFMNACDELGLVVVDAILGWQYYNDDDKFRNYCYTSARNLIRRDRNHACVLSWEVSLNETKMPIFFMEELDKIVHEEYPGPNVYSCGWMDDVYDIYFQARQHRILHPHDSISKPYMVSEYGDWEYHSNNAGLNQDKVSRTMRSELSSRQLRSHGEERLQNQAFNLQESYNDNMRTPAYADGYWVMYDYNRGYHSDIEASGVMDIFRLPKFGYYFYQSQACPKAKPMVNIASYWTPKSALTFKVYSNAQQVKLTLNGKEIATQKPDSDNNTENLAHPPFTFNLAKFEAGELKASAYIDGKVVAEHTVNTPQAPTHLKVWIDESGKAPEAGCNDVIFLYMAAVDANGTVSPQYSETLELTIDGNAEILNVGALKAEAGIATALIRIGDASGKISVKANSKKLNGQFTFETK